MVEPPNCREYGDEKYIYALSGIWTCKFSMCSIRDHLWITHVTTRISYRNRSTLFKWREHVFLPDTSAMHEVCCICCHVIELKKRRKRQTLLSSEFWTCLLCTWCISGETQATIMKETLFILRINKERWFNTVVINTN